MKYYLWKKSVIFSLLSFGALLCLYIFLYKIYMPRVNAFGCFDDCFNFMGGYFLLHGKQLYAQIFFNHAPGMAYISALVQYLFHPQNLYDIVLKHRQFVFFFSFFLNLVLLLRFGYPILFFVIIFETTKFYFFGDRFLAEALILYPLIYLAGLVWRKLQDKRIFSFDFIVAGLFTWFVVWMREPYVPVALFLFGAILWNKTVWREKGIGLAVFLLLSCITLFYHNLSELYFSVVTTNATTIIPLENVSHNIFGSGLLTAFFYPIYILMGGQHSYLYTIELLLDVLFLTGVILAWSKASWKYILYAFAVLGLANLRYTAPGREFYEAFHQIVWYALFLFFTIQFVLIVPQKNRRITSFLGMTLIILFIFVSPSSFWRDKINPYTEFITNYGNVLQAGEVVSNLSQPSDTLFVDGYDDMVYWVSKRYSLYPYSWYTSLMPRFEKYTDARERMFAIHPPEFYYGSCQKGMGPARTLTPVQKNLYVQLLEDGKPSCIWVKKTKIPHITQNQWKEANDGYFTLPTTEE